MSLHFDGSFITQRGQLFKQPPDPNLSIKEQALKFFEDIIGNDDVKENIYRSLLRENLNQNILLVGAPSTSKTMFCKIIEDKCNNVIFYDASAGSTGAGLIEQLRRNRNTKILIIDEITEMKKTDIEVTRGLLNDGRVSKTLKSEHIMFKLPNLKVFGTTNNPNKLSLPIKSRFQMYLIDSYDDDTFIKVLMFCLRKQNIIKNEKMAEELAYAMLKHDIRVVRTALSICALVDETRDTYNDIERIIMNYYTNDASQIDINYNTEVA